MVNIYDFICANSSYFDQLIFDDRGELFIDYLCPLRENQSLAWSHKNCLMYVAAGSKGYASADRYHESHEHQILFIRKGGHIFHQRFEEPYRALIFMFEDASIKEFLAEYPALLAGKTLSESEFIDQPVVLELASSEFIRSIFISSLDYLKDPTPESRISLKLKFKELLVNLLREKGSNHFYTYLSWLCHEEDIAFVKLMRENSHCNFTIEQLAKVAGMSSSSFKRTFKRNFGISPGKWLDEQRISRAIALLSNTFKTISEISFELGYSDASAFAKGLKRATGKIPAYYRKKTSAELK